MFLFLVSGDMFLKCILFWRLPKKWRQGLLGLELFYSYFSVCPCSTDSLKTVLFHEARECASRVAVYKPDKVYCRLQLRKSTCES